MIKNARSITGIRRFNYPVSSGAPLTPEILWMKLNEGSGTTAADSTGSGNTGTLTGGASWTTGPNSNSAVTLDGIDGYIAIANEANFDFDFGSSFSITCWIKINTSSSGGRPVVTKQNQSGNTEGIYLRADTDSNFLRLDLVNTSGTGITVYSTIGNFTKNVWRLVCVTYDGSSLAVGLNMYINGTTDNNYVGTAITGTMLNSNPLWIGRGVAGYFYGDVDDGRFYNRVLSSTEVSDIYVAGAQ